MSDPSCRNYRELLGVYVVGAIEPHERAAVDDHLGQCYECREELAGLAPLPALLRRVPTDEAERIVASDHDPAGLDAEPPAELLNALLKRTVAKRRSGRVRAMFATAAAILIAVGGAAAVGKSLGTQQHHPTAAQEVSTASAGRVTATVKYGKSAWGMAMSVRVTGVARWTNCKFYVLTKDGQRDLVAAWTVGEDGESLWYPVAAHVSESRLNGFVLVAGQHRPLRIPAA
jgi:predicted anti-sigma-YlaC factor YlaD